MPHAFEKEQVESVLQSINQRSAELIDELRDYTQRVKQADPTNDDRSAFEGWTIQKISGLQITLEILTEEIRRLGGAVMQEKR